MRTREEITKEAGKYAGWTQGPIKLLRLVLEVLLDIRDQKSQ